MGPGEAEGVQQADRVAGEPGGAVAGAGRLAPAEAAQVGHEQAVVAVEPLDDPAPAPPVLWPAMEQQHRRARARLGHMQPHPSATAWDVQPVMLDSGQGREPVHSRRRGRNGHNGNLSSPRRGAKRRRRLRQPVLSFSSSCTGGANGSARPRCHPRTTHPRRGAGYWDGRPAGGTDPGQPLRAGHGGRPRSTPRTPALPAGVPQSRHLHVLLGRGLECLEQLFAGFEADLVAADAPVVKGSESLWLNAAGWSRRYQSPIRLLGASRELIEWQARTRVTALDKVQVLEGCQAIGLLTDPSRDAVTGVRLRSRDGRGDETGPATEVVADLVVDASGRQSRAPQWLAELGYQPPAETTISSRLGYA